MRCQELSTTVLNDAPPTRLTGETGLALVEPPKANQPSTLDVSHAALEISAEYSAGYLTNSPRELNLPFLRLDHRL